MKSFLIGEAYDFLLELQILLKYKHENIVGLVDYCKEVGENIIVYDYASRGSLNMHLKDNDLTWMKRLEICVDIAKGLDFLHGGTLTQEVVIHRNIRSSNVLLDEEWKAKITSFGISLITPINKDMDFVTDNYRSTNGYCDPQHAELGFFTKESDIYSLGVVLVEILRGRLIHEFFMDYFQNLTDLFKRYHEQGKLDEMVFEGIKDQIVPKSLSTFQMIAYQCLHREREKRPTAGEVLLQLKKAFEFQVSFYILRKFFSFLIKIFL